MTSSRSASRMSPWVIGVILFMLVVVAVNATMIVLAVRSSRGEIEINPYEKGMKYQSTIDQYAEFSRLEWATDRKLLRNEQNNVALRVSVLHNGIAVSGQHLRADIIRPADMEYDRHCDLRELTGGTYQCELGPLPSGPYAIKLWRGSAARLDFDLLLE